MSYRIKATPPQLRASATTIENNANEIQREVTQVRQLLDQLRNTFIGNRATKFYGQFDQAYTDMQQWDDIVRSFAEEMRIAANRIEAADNSG